MDKPQILKKILDHKAKEVDQAKQHKSLEFVREQAEKSGPCRGFFKALEKPGPYGVNIIAEVKRASPSKGVIRPGLDPARQAQAYQEGGAQCMSVLTDENFFQGSVDDLMAARAACNLPVIRKDFMIDSYQVYEAAAMGADAILLIASAIEDDFLTQGLALAKSLGLDVLVEVHTAEELQRATDAGAVLVGVNNRNLHTFEVDIQTTVELKQKMIPGQVAVCESGIKSHEDIQMIKEAGVFNFLIGESLVRADDPKEKLARLMGLEK